MKQMMKYTFAIVTMLLVSLGAKADGDIRINSTHILINIDGGVTPYTTEKGTVTGSINDNRVVTLTITPAEGYFILKDKIIVVKTVDGTYAQTRTADFNTPLALTGDDVVIGPTAKTYTFTLPQDYVYGADITIDFQAVIDITDAEITLSESTFTYDGTEKKPTVTSVKLNSEELNSTYYTVGYSNNTNAGDATVSVTGSGIYKNAATKTFTISKATITLSYSAATAEGKMGETFTAPTLSNPSQVAVTYSSSNTEVATIGTDGAVTLKGPGKTTIAATFAGNDNYEGATASYELTVAAKQQDSGLSWTDEGVEYYLGDEWYAPRLNNPNKLKVKYESSDEDVATIDEEGEVTPLSAGDTWIMAIFEGNDEFEPQTVRYGLFVKERFDLWVGGERVTSENSEDILGNGQFFYNGKEKMLVVTNSSEAVDIENRKGDLTIFLNGGNKLGRIFFNKGETDNSGSLKITTYENIPGATTLQTDNGNGVISGFSSLTIDEESYTFLLDPEKGSYQGGQLVTADGAVAQSAIIGQYIKPLANGRTMVFPPGDFDGDDTGLRNKVINDILFTLIQRDGESEEDDDYYAPTEACIVLNNLTSTQGVEVVLDNIKKGEYIPGSSDYAAAFQGGITFMVPNGEGKITLNVQTEPGYKLMLKICEGIAHEIEQSERGDVEFDYSVQEPTYCFLYLEKSAATTRGTRIGKREKSRGKVFSVRVSPSRAYSTNPLGGLSGFPESQTPEVSTFGDPTGIKEIKVETDNTLESKDDSWYDLQGRKIGKPTKAGIYIQNKKKFVIK